MKGKDVRLNKPYLFDDEEIVAVIHRIKDRDKYKWVIGFGKNARTQVVDNSEVTKYCLSNGETIVGASRLKPINQ